MTTQRVRLTHVSHKPGAAGLPGDVVTVDEQTAAMWVRAGGCVLLDDAAAKAIQKPAESDEAAETEKSKSRPVDKPAKAAK